MALGPDSRSSTRSDPGAAGVAKLPSKAPWSDGVAKLDKRNYAALVAAARTSPSSGSYTLAARALSECAVVRGEHDKRVASINADSRRKVQRQQALDALEQPCAGFGSVDELVAQRSILFKEGELAGDALIGALEDGYRLADAKMPRGARQAKLYEMLELQDGEAFRHLRAGLIADGASFEGAPITATERGPYGLALQLAACDLYGSSCGGADSTQSLKDCAYHGDCEGYDFARGLQMALPPYMYERIGNYYPRVRDRLAARQYEVFGLP
jgi:hypothetical protein